MLYGEGCSLMQGFLFSKPMPPEDVQTWMESVALPRKVVASPSAAKVRASAGEVVDVGRRL